MHKEDGFSLAQTQQHATRGERLSRRAWLKAAHAAVLGAGVAKTAWAQTQNASSVTTVWADAIANARYEDLSAEVLQRTKLCILDNLGVIVHTSTLPELRSYLDRQFRNAGPAEATVWGYGRKLPLETAAACNAFLIHGNEIDDSDFRSNYRPSCVSLPAPLSVAEYTQATGRDLLLATALAYTVNGRLAAQLDRLQGLGFMPSSVVGGGGTAAATAKLMKLNAQQTLWALGLGIAGGGGLFQYYFDQTEEKKLHVARTVRMGVESAQLAAKGYEGPRHIVEGASGLLPSYLRETGRKPDYAALKRDLRQFEGPLYVYPKFTSTSSSIGPFLDALAPVYQREKLQPADIERFVIVREWPLDSPFVQKILHFEPPPTIVGAQLNMNYSIALFLQRGSASVYDFTPAALQDKAVLALAAKTGYELVAPTDDFAVKLVLRAGRTLSAPFKYSHGEKPEPVMQEMRMAKFAALTRERLTVSTRQQVIEMVERLDTVKNVAEWTAALHKLLQPLPRKTQ
ncbi:MAG: MmgE/PrpD family protein [Acidobacteria bacterium]|nr:MmgE/PrpD family protein [Acidobacteriota bacterium]MBI3425437.1 MmgE/PrpD family protein [Acidobacteriota bacterium]